MDIHLFEARNIIIAGNRYEEDYTFAVDKLVYKNISINDGFKYDNQQAVTINSNITDVDVKNIDDILNAYQSNLTINSYTNGVTGQVVTFYNFTNTTVTFTQGTFYNKTGSNKSITQNQITRYVFRNAKWWEV